MIFCRSGPPRKLVLYRSTQALHYELIDERKSTQCLAFRSALQTRLLFTSSLLPLFTPTFLLCKTSLSPSCQPCHQLHEHLAWRPETSRGGGCASAFSPCYSPSVERSLFLATSAELTSAQHRGKLFLPHLPIRMIFFMLRLSTTVFPIIPAVSTWSTRLKFSQRNWVKFMIH